MNINKELLSRVKEEILREPSLFDMDNWTHPISFYGPSQFGGTTSHSSRLKARWDIFQKHMVCGSVCCIAGHAVKLHDPEQYNYLSTTSGAGGWENAACDALGIPIDYHCMVFFTSHWPFEYFESYKEAYHKNDFVGMAQVAAQYIDEIIATNGQCLIDYARK